MHDPIIGTRQHLTHTIASTTPYKVIRPAYWSVGLSFEVYQYQIRI
ncbi:hypothetical protein M8C21_033232 [Ambrosia artemisiifolia]|uniref:Uncharacterized protein n=1 Tax=Ambrosia artemisiifolia TaxID=4212 RepID=A0AAD5GS35_AMBAR|nr:hypothetical protein M8C21_033232 [Ambrosia artemisiifolia]